MKKTTISSLYNIFKKYPSISTDSRKIKKDSIYFSLKGENFNGNKFAKEALQKGAIKAVVDQKEYALNDDYLFVENGLEALQALAKHHRKQLAIPILGITGSNGKTTTKALIASVLRQKYRCFATVGNLNNHIGVPLSVLSLQEDHQLGIIEMGANHQGEIKFLCSIAQPNYGIITNIGKSHLEGFGGIEGVIKGKSELYQFIRSINGELFINNDDKLLLDLAKGIKAQRYGRSIEADCSGELSQTHPRIKGKWACHKKKGLIDAKIYGAYNFTNIMAAICVGNYFDVAASDIDHAINNYQAKNNRSQYIKKPNYEIYLDAYNANPSSMKLAIENFAQNKGYEKWCILGDMYEVGKNSEKEHHAIIDLVEKKEIKNSVFIGDNFYQHCDSKDNFIFFKDLSSAERWFQTFQKDNKQFLIKGSRGVGLERLIEE